MRGKAAKSEDAAAIDRITPACAGKRRSDWIIRSIYWDHPRVCGEKMFGKNSNIQDVGSPPRMRGKVFVDGEV